MNKRPDALLCADLLDVGFEPNSKRVAALLRKQHEINSELASALMALLHGAEMMGWDLSKALAAIEKHEAHNRPASSGGFTWNEPLSGAPTR